MGDTYPRFIVATVQAASVLFDRDKTIDKAVRLIEEVADRSADAYGPDAMATVSLAKEWPRGK